MQPRKLNVLFCRFPYAGNGGTMAEHPNIADWLVRTVLKAKSDPRIGDIFHKKFADTPITAVRNHAIEWAKKCGADIIVMVDSDQHPDILLGSEPGAKPFFDTAFDFIYANYDKGPHVVGAPYCGPPPCENIYVFQWANWNTHRPDHEMRMEPFTREEAARRTGLEAVAALPTGCIMYDMRCFDHIEKPYFYYEYKDDGLPCEKCHQRKPGPQSQKASTEDVTNTRDISMHVHLALGYNPVYCAWDCWAGHYKPLCVSKPVLTSIDQVGAKYVAAVHRKERLTERELMVGEPMEPLDIDLGPHVGKETRIQNLQQALLKECGGSEGLAKSLNDAYRKLLGPDFMDDINRRIQERMKARATVEELREFNAYPTELKISQRDDGVELVGMLTLPDQLEALGSIVAGVANHQKGLLQCVEIGSWVGESALAIRKGFLFGGHLTCVDTWKGSPTDQTADFVAMADGDLVFETFRKNTAAYPDISTRRQTSLESASTINRWFDFIYIDADHSYSACKADIQAWLPLLKPGGVIAGHDYHCAGFPGVTQAVDEMFPGIVHQDTNIWWVRQEDIAALNKKAQDLFDETIRDIGNQNDHVQRTPEQEAVRAKVLDAMPPDEPHDMEHVNVTAGDTDAERAENEAYRQYIRNCEEDEEILTKQEWLNDSRFDHGQQAELAPEPDRIFENQLWYGRISDDEYRKAIAAAPPGSHICRIIN